MAVVVAVAKNGATTAVMNQRRCRYCHSVFQPSKFRPLQQVCGNIACQRQRRADYHRNKIATDAEYHAVCIDSPRKWRARNPDYWRQYRAEHPETAARNRNQQKLRDRKQRLCNLANNTLAQDLKHSAAEIWLVGSATPDLANNNLASGQVWVIEALTPFRPPSPPSCKQHPSGAPALSTG